jgi:hypothetical protein
VGFEPTTPEFEREKTVHALDRAANVIGESTNIDSKYEDAKKWKKKDHCSITQQTFW